jgi:hypothetical protein
MYHPESKAGKESEKWLEGMPDPANALHRKPEGRTPQRTDLQSLRMVRVVPEESVKERFGRWLLAAATRLDGDKDRVNLR